MPTLDWLDRQAAFRIASSVPTRVLRPHPRARAVVAIKMQTTRNTLPAGRQFTQVVAGEALFHA
jgi:hypothetical protein